MLRSTILASCVIAGMMLSCSFVGAEAPLNLLFFGNSYSLDGDVPEVVGKIAVADRHSQPMIVADLGGGRDLDDQIVRINDNSERNVAHPAIAGKTFDYAVIQGHSTEATHLQNPDTDFIPDAVELSQLIRSAPTGGDARIVLFQTWAREAPHSFYTNNSPSFASPAEMQSEIRSNYGLARDTVNSHCKSRVSVIAPVGDGFELGEFSHLFYGNAIRGDDHHDPSTMGSRLVSLIIYRTIYNEEVGDIPYSAVSDWIGISPSQWGIITGLADEVGIEAIPEPASSAVMVSGLIAGSLPSQPIGTMMGVNE